MRKIPTRLLGTNFCTSSARFSKTFVRQPNSPECTQVVRNVPKCQFRVHWGGSGVFVWKNSNVTSWHELWHYFVPFCTEFRKQPSSPECTQIVQNLQNVSLGSNGMDRERSLRKIPTRLHGTNFCTSSAHFAPSFVWQPNGPECPQIVETHQNVSLGSNGVDRVRSLRKIPTRLHGTNFCTSSARFAPIFVRQPNSTKRTKTSF